MAGLIKRIGQAAAYVIAGVGPENWFGPLQPVDPMAPKDVKGRAWDYPTGLNLNYRPRSIEPVGFERLKLFAENCNILRIVMERQKDLLEGMEWKIMPKADYSNMGQRPAEQKFKAQIDEWTTRFKTPDNIYDWGQWLRQFLEQVYVYDALTIWERPTLAGKLFALELFDGRTIQPLIDQTGRRPLGDSPAFAQIFKGVPAVEFKNAEMIYFPKNPRVDRLYGYSRVQQIIDTAETAIHRQASQTLYFREGNVPDGIFTGPKEWTNDDIKQWQIMWDDLNAGNLAERRHGRWAPSGTLYTALKQPPLKDEFDEWLARIICYAFSTNPGPFIKAQNRSNQESQQEVAEEGGIATDMAFIKRVMDLVMARNGADQIEFMWSEDREFDPSEAAKIDDLQLGNGSKNLNEIRSRLGLDPVDGGDTPLLRSGTGWVTLDSILNPPQPAPAVSIDPNEANRPKDEKGESDTKIDQNGSKSDEPPLGKGAPDSPDPAEDEAYVVKAIAATTPKVAKALKTLGMDIAHQALRRLLMLAKDADEPNKDAKKTAADVVENLTLDKLADLIDEIEPALSSTAADAGEAAMAQIGSTSTSAMVNRVSLKAVAFARNRAAELVGKRYTKDGDLIDSPNPKFAIDETTRDMLRQTIEDGLQNNIGSQKIAEAIRNDYAFSKERAAVITHTEISRANNQGKLIGARVSQAEGLNLKKVWYVSNLGCCPICETNRESAPLMLDEDFPSGDGAPPAHPRCRCSLGLKVKFSDGA